VSSQLRPLLAASVKMFYRSLDNVWFAAVSPFVLLAVMVLAKRLHFAFVHGSGTVSFFTFTAIGWAAFFAAHINQDGTVGAASGYRAQGVLKRIAATPISAAVFILAQVLTRLAFALIETLVFLAAAVALGAHIHYTADLVWIVPVATIALLTGTGFGFAIAGFANNPEAANQLNIGLFTPVLLLAGVQYPLQGLPGVLPHLAEYVVPFAAPVQAFREAVAGHLAGDFPRLLAISIAWLAVAAVLAVRSYRLVERDT
jgi:ABC-type polysaccharide/polyol phosphate export permease